MLVFLSYCEFIKSLMLLFFFNEYGSKMTGLFPGFTKVLHLGC